MDCPTTSSLSWSICDYACISVKMQKALEMIQRQTTCSYTQCLALIDHPTDVASDGVYTLALMFAIVLVATILYMDHHGFEPLLNLIQSHTASVEIDFGVVDDDENDEKDYSRVSPDMDQDIQTSPVSQKAVDSNSGLSASTISLRGSIRYENPVRGSNEDDEQMSGGIDTTEAEPGNQDKQVTEDECLPDIDELEKDGRTGSSEVNNDEDLRKNIDKESENAQNTQDPKAADEKKSNEESRNGDADRSETKNCKEVQNDEEKKNEDDGTGEPRKDDDNEAQKLEYDVVENKYEEGEAKEYDVKEVDKMEPNDEEKKDGGADSKEHKASDDKKADKSDDVEKKQDSKVGDKAGDKNDSKGDNKDAAEK